MTELFSQNFLLLSQMEKDDDLIQIRGKLLLSLRYAVGKQILYVRVMRCAELAAMDSNGYSDPYVKVYVKTISTYL